MEIMGQPPASRDIAAAFGKYFHNGDGPSHRRLTEVFSAAGLSDVAPGTAQQQEGSTKAERVRRTVEAACRKPERARELVDALLSCLRTDGCLYQNLEATEGLKRALGRQGWSLDSEGYLTPVGEIDLETGGRSALDDQIRRMRMNTDDPALLLGTAKELLESTAKYVLRELSVETSSKTPDFNDLWHLTRKRLNILPENIAGDGDGNKCIKVILQSSWRIIEQVNTLRNLQWTGHGRTLPSGVTREQALLVAREACSMAEFTLMTLDQQVGRR